MILANWPGLELYLYMNMVLVQRISLEETMNRWYFVAVQPTLFEPCAVIIAWGRRDNEFQQWRAIPAESEEHARKLVEKIIQHKLKRGYRPAK